MPDKSLPAEFQALVEQYELADVLAHPSLDRHARHLVALTACAMMGTEADLADCITNAVADGVTDSQVAEVFLTLAVAAGLPAARQAFIVAQRVLSEREQTDHGSPAVSRMPREREPDGLQN